MNYPIALQPANLIVVGSAADIAAALLEAARGIIEVHEAVAMDGGKPLVGADYKSLSDLHTQLAEAHQKAALDIKAEFPSAIQAVSAHGDAMGAHEDAARTAIMMAPTVVDEKWDGHHGEIRPAVWNTENKVWRKAHRAFLMSKNAYDQTAFHTGGVLMDTNNTGFTKGGPGSGRHPEGGSVVPEGHGARTFDPQTAVSQIGRMNILAISGGRVGTITQNGRPVGLELPVGRGYKVRVFLHDNDTYTVQRVYSRAGKDTVKGQESGIYADEVGEKAYQASSFVNVPFGDHDPMRKSAEIAKGGPGSGRHPEGIELSNASQLLLGAKQTLRAYVGGKINNEQLKTLIEGENPRSYGMDGAIGEHQWLAGEHRQQREDFDGEPLGEAHYAAEMAHFAAEQAAKNVVVTINAGGSKGDVVAALEAWVNEAFPAAAFSNMADSQSVTKGGPGSGRHPNAFTAARPQYEDALAGSMDGWPSDEDDVDDLAGENETYISEHMSAASHYEQMAHFADIDGDEASANFLREAMEANVAAAQALANVGNGVDQDEADELSEIALEYSRSVNNDGIGAIYENGIEKGGPGSGRLPAGHAKAVSIIRSAAAESRSKLRYKKPSFKGSTYMGAAKHNTAAESLDKWADQIEQHPEKSLDEHKQDLQDQIDAKKRRDWDAIMTDASNPFSEVGDHIHDTVRRAIGSGQAAQRVADRTGTF
jgi:hypothetical protein